MDTKSKCSEQQDTFASPMSQMAKTLVTLLSFAFSDEEAFTNHPFWRLLAVGNGLRQYLLA